MKNPKKQNKHTKQKTDVLSDERYIFCQQENRHWIGITTNSHFVFAFEYYNWFDMYEILKDIQLICVNITIKHYIDLNLFNVLCVNSKQL